MSRTRIVILSASLLVSAGVLRGEQVTVRHPEGVVHAFLRLSSLEGAALADGDLTQQAQGDRVTTHMVFRFKNGSTHDETTVFTQHDQFRLISHHLIQKGPTFPEPLEMTTDTTTGRVTVRYTNDKGETKVETEQMKLPADMANGMVPILLKNLAPGVAKIDFGMTVSAPKPRLVRLLINAVGEESFSTGGVTRKATHYVVKIDLGGLAGLLAPAAGKQPPDTHVWIFGGDTPTFVKSEGQLFRDGPSWRIELVSATWPR